MRRDAVEALESELYELPTSVARVRRVERFLLALQRPEDDDALVRRAVLQMGGRDGAVGSAGSVAQLADALGASQRTLERRFRRAIGVAPKRFARVVRLQAALARRERPVRWSEFAVDAGYYDQAHLIRETRELFGMAPQALLAPLDNPIAREAQALAREASMATTLFR